MTQTFTYDEFKLDVADKWKRYMGPEEGVLNRPGFRGGSLV